jgi:H+/Cl- antiporter ClcA
VLALFYPQLLGNGRSIAHLSFDSDLTLGLAGILLLLRLSIIAGALRAGAYGGLLTPGLSIGALLGTIGGIAFSHQWPATPVGAFAVVGATAFLASSMKMPLTAIALGIEFTGVGLNFFVPIMVAVSGSVCIDYVCREYATRRQKVFAVRAPSFSAREAIRRP